MIFLPNIEACGHSYYFSLSSLILVSHGLCKLFFKCKLLLLLMIMMLVMLIMIMMMMIFVAGCSVLLLLFGKSLDAPPTVESRASAALLHQRCRHRQLRIRSFLHCMLVRAAVATNVWAVSKLWTFGMT